jgi:hypothetical protein
LRKYPATQIGCFPVLVSFLLCDVQYVGRCTLPTAWSKLRKSGPSPARAHASLGRTKHQSIKRQQPNTRNPNYHSAPTHTHTHTHPHPKKTTTHTTYQKCPSSSARAAPSPLPPRRSQQQKPRSRWFPTCSTSRSHPYPYR